MYELHIVVIYSPTGQLQNILTYSDWQIGQALSIADSSLLEQIQVINFLENYCCIPREIASKIVFQFNLIPPAHKIAHALQTHQHLTYIASFAIANHYLRTF